MGLAANRLIPICNGRRGQPRVVWGLERVSEENVPALENVWTMTKARGRVEHFAVTLAFGQQMNGLPGLFLVAFERGPAMSSA
jgi:hypothetical protein